MDASTSTDGDRLAYRARQHSLGPGRHELLLVCLPSQKPGHLSGELRPKGGNVTTLDEASLSRFSMNLDLTSENVIYLVMSMTLRRRLTDHPP